MRERRFSKQEREAADRLYQAAVVVSDMVARPGAVAGEHLRDLATALTEYGKVRDFVPRRRLLRTREGRRVAQRRLRPDPPARRGPVRPPREPRRQVERPKGGVLRLAGVFGDDRLLAIVGTLMVAALVVMTVAVFVFQESTRCPGARC